MSNPQQPELARSRKTPALDPDAAAGVIEGQRDVGEDAPRGPVPPENQPGHHPPKEQDKPDLNAFADKLGVTEPSDRQEEPAFVAEQRQDPSPLVERVRSRGLVVAIGAAFAVLLAVLAGRRIRSRRSR